MNKRKLRKILAVLDPSKKGSLTANQVKDDVSESLASLTEKITKKISELRADLLTELALRETPDLSNEIQALRTEIEAKLKNLEQEDIGTIQTQMQELVTNDIQTDENLRGDLEDRIKKLRNEFITRLNNLGGGSQNRQININSSVMSAKWTDLNFGNTGGIGWTVTDDNTNRRVNITPSILTGASGGGNVTKVGTPVDNQVGVWTGDGTIEGDSKLTWSGSKLTITTGSIDVSGATSNFHSQLEMDNDVSLYFGGGSGNGTGLKTGSDGTFLFDTGPNSSIKLKGTSGGGTNMGYTDSSFNYVWRSDSSGNTTQGGKVQATSIVTATTPTYSPSNVTLDRTYDANSTSVDELADILGTLIADLKSAGLIQ